MRSTHGRVHADLDHLAVREMVSRASERLLHPLPIEEVE
jgi:hypothetical protein